jgi:hypothetical protein
LQASNVRDRLRSSPREPIKPRSLSVGALTVTAVICCRCTGEGTVNEVC